MEHTTTYELVMRMIEAGLTIGLAEKVDVFYLAGRITEDEYKEIMEILQKINK